MLIAPEDGTDVPSEKVLPLKPLKLIFVVDKSVVFTLLYAVTILLNEIPDEPIAPDIFTYIIGKYI